MRGTLQAPIPRKQFQQWSEDERGVLVEVRHSSGSELRVCRDTEFPEISVLFIGDTENFNDTVEICGMYDKKAHEFRFVSDQLASIIDGISDAERWPGTHTSEDVYDRIANYAKEAMELRGFRFQSETDKQFAEVQQDMRTALSVMIDYAAVLAARGERDAVLDTRDLAQEMLYFWRDPVYLLYERGYEKVERQYLERFDQAVDTAIESRQIPAFDSDQAYSLLRSLAVQAEEATQNEDVFSVWECCHLAKRVIEDYPDLRTVFNGDFTPDYNDRFTNFGSQDWQNLHEGQLLDKPVLVFNNPVPDEQLPEGWHSYHLAGRNIWNANTLLKTPPEKGYAGTVVSPYVLIRASYQSRQLKEPLGMIMGQTSMDKFCERHRLPQPTQAEAPRIGMEGMSL